MQPLVLDVCISQAICFEIKQVLQLLVLVVRFMQVFSSLFQLRSHGLNVPNKIKMLAKSIGSIPELPANTVSLVLSVISIFRNRIVVSTKLLVFRPHYLNMVVKSAVVGSKIIIIKLSVLISLSKSLDLILKALNLLSKTTVCVPKILICISMVFGVSPKDSVGILNGLVVSLEAFILDCKSVPILPATMIHFLQLLEYLAELSSAKADLEAWVMLRSLRTGVVYESLWIPPWRSASIVAWMRSRARRFTLVVFKIGGLPRA